MLKFVNRHGFQSTIDFQYEYTENSTVTKCIIQYPKPPIVDIPNTKQYIGVAVLHPKDKFVKETGRKVALKHALTHAHINLSYEDRHDIWTNYFLRKGRNNLLKDKLTFPAVEDAIAYTIGNKCIEVKSKNQFKRLNHQINDK